MSGNGLGTQTDDELARDERRLAEARKSFRLTVTYQGAAPEGAYAAMVASAVEKGDYSKTARVVDIQLLTDIGATEKIAPDRLRELGFGPQADRQLRAIPSVRLWWIVWLLVLSGLMAVGTVNGVRVLWNWATS